MASTGAHLVDTILPAVPLRQWVITVPQPLRAMLSYDTALCGVVVNEHIRSVFKWLKRKAKEDCGAASVSKVYPGAITAVPTACLCRATMAP